MAEPGTWAKRTRVVAMLAALGLVVASAATVGPAARAEGPSQITLDKNASVTTVAPGEAFNYQLEVGCSAVDLGTGCTNATLVDAVPDEFEILGVTVGTGLTAEPPDIDGNTVTVVFNFPLVDPPGAIGLPASASGFVIVQVRARSDLPFEQNGVPVDNTATLTATNQIAPASSTATVVPAIPLALAATAAKDFDPRVASAVPGATTTMSISATNTSNSAVESITLTDPSDPAAAPNPFDLLAVTGLGTLTLPTGADQVRVDAFVGGVWVVGVPAATAALPAGVDPPTVTGVRFVFTDSGGGGIPAGATASVGVELEQRDAVTDLADPFSVRNDMSGTVAVGAETGSALAAGTYQILPSAVQVGATKVVTPPTVVAGQSTTATLGGSNDSFSNLATMQITEPAAPAQDLYSNGFPAGVAFGGFTDEVVWPAGATSAEVHYYFADLTDEVIAAGARDSLPPPVSAERVVRFVVTFSGDMPPGQSASVPFTVETDADVTDDTLVLTNTSTVTGTTAAGEVGEADATATFTVYATRLSISSGKSISPNQILSTPGEFVIVQLPSQLRPYPASTTDALRIVVQDPQGTPPVATEWWNRFDVAAITQTAVPAGATLTVRYWNGAAWTVLPGASGIPGPQLFSLPIPPALQETIQGLQFVFDSEEGFPPGTTVQPNLTMNLRDQLRDGSGPAAGDAATVENCAGAAARNGLLFTQSVTPAPCPTVTLVPGDFPGADDFIGKSWVGEQVITARTDDRVAARLNWSTGGRSNIDPMVLSDTAFPTTTGIDDSVFNAFDLVGLPAITATDDPLLTFDRVQSVELFDGTSWTEAAGDQCPAACDGVFPGVTLTAAERASTIGVRLVVTESPTRAERSVGNPTAPPVGSGVARSIGNNRALLLTFQIRNDVRDPVATPDPVVGTRFYNTAEAGAVENTASATATSTLDGSTIVDTAAAVIRILDVPLNVRVGKTWTGGPLGIPQAGTDPAIYPSGRLTVTATNATAANVDRLEIADPSVDGAAAPFDSFDLLRFVTISIPPGATNTTVEITDSDGDTASFSRTQAFSLPASVLADVVAVRVIHEGRIDAGAVATLSFDTRLRPTHRSDGLPVTIADSPVPNEASAGVSDEGGAPGGTPTATASAQMPLAAGTIDVTATKTFAPDSQTEGQDGPVVLTLTGQPLGTVRPVELTLTDDAGTFWNAFDFAGFATPLAFATPIDRVAVDACVGRDWADATADCESDGGVWQLGTPVTSSAANASPLPAGVLPGDVEGLRFTFTRADGAQWQNPANPIQGVALSVQRRTELRTGGPVLTDLAGNAPAPGETAAGVFSNSLTADVVGVLNDGGTPFTDSAQAVATVAYRHLATSVSVQKAPSGIQQPGSIIPYTLTVTNTGQIALTDPVITDRLPVDGSGPLLVFDPFADPTGPGPYSYTLDGGAPTPPSGLALPTDPAQVTETVGDDGAEIVFAFPPGSVLEVGQTYVVRIELMFRTGIAAQTVVTNSFGIVGDRPFDSCGGTLDAPTGECRAQTTVTVQTAGALRGIKAVRADDTELGVREIAPGVPCVASPGGFYTGPCVPVTKPGGTETWRIGIVNTGTVPMNRLVAIDRLPVPGDTGVIINLPRGSQWRAAFTGDFALADAPAGATMTTFSTTGAPCVGDLLLTGPPCPVGSWSPWDGTGDPDTVTALKFVVDFPTPLQPADQILIDLGTRTPAVAPEAAVEPVAWNTAAVGGLAVINSVPVSTTQTEGNKVGVALATGSLAFEKVVTGDGAEFAPDSFTGAVECVSAGETVPPRPITLVPGETVAVDDLPWGAECTVVEDAAGQTTSTATTATVGSPGDPVGVVTVTNRYDLAALIVTKQVESAAVDETGAAVPYGPFAVEVACEFLDEPVVADGPMSADLADGESLELVGLPAGTQCVVTETDARGATSTTVRVDDGAAVDGDSVEVGLVADSAVAVSFVNAFDVGKLVIEKSVDGPGAAAFGAGPFVFAIDCELTDASGARPVWNGTVTLGGGQPLTTTVEDIAAGAVCDIAETADGGADATQLEPARVTVAADTPVTVTAVNTFSAGALHIEKQRVGPGADLYGAGPFEVTTTCLRLVNGLPVGVEIPGGATRALTEDNDYAADYALLPAGAVCFVSETSTGGATESEIVDGEGERTNIVTIADGETAQLTAVNTFAVGAVRVAKSVRGDSGAAEFAVRLECTALVDGEARPVPVPGGGDRTVTAGATVLYGPLPAGAACTVSEPQAGGADSTVLTPADGVITVVADDVVEVGVVNVFDPPLPPTSPPSTSLSATGTDPVGLLVAAMLSGAAGVILILIGRRRLRRR